MDFNLSQAQILAELPESIVKENEDIGLKEQSGSGENSLISVLKKGQPDDYEHKVFYLDNIHSFKRKHRLRKKLTAKERKKLKLYKISSKIQSYDSFLPLHELWTSYMKEILPLHRYRSTVSNFSELEIKIQKADFHGAILMVTRSKCPSLVGMTGIVVQETKNTFNIVTKQNKLKTIPKENSVFTLRVEEFIFTIYGNHFVYKASDRVTKKFKSRPTIDL